MKTNILKVKGDWQEVVDDSRSTVGKLPLGKEPSAEFKRKILLRSLTQESPGFSRGECQNEGYSVKAFG